jgi:hypothetical protein
LIQPTRSASWVLPNCLDSGKDLDAFADAGDLTRGKALPA